MQNISTTRDRWVWVIAGALMAATLAVELVTPLGYAVWLTYFVAVGVTVFQNRTQVPLIVGALSCVLLAVGFNLAPSSTNSSFSSINRSIGGVSFLAMALVVTQAIRARRQAEFALWLQQAENTVEASLRGDQSPEALADAAVSALCDTLDAQVGALYRIEGERLRLTGGTALPADMPKTLPTNTGQLGDALQRGAVRRVRGVDAGHLQIASSLGKSSCQELLLAPVTADGRVIGIVELGRVTDPRTAGSREQELLARCGENIGLALRTALLRAQLVTLLEETQRQSEELQTQQEELRVTNEELEEQSRSLQQSQSDLEQQQAELEQTNVQLEERTQALEAQKQALLVAQNQLVRNSNELSTASRYKSEFLANMSHELRTPLNSALILAKLLADNKDGTLSPEQVKYAQAILSSNNDLLALINDILDLSKIEAGHVELADDTIATSSVLQRLRETFEPLARQKGLALQITADADAPTQLVMDSQRLQQILKNLLANAIKFTEHGSVSLSLQAQAPGRVLFKVQDTGIGIAREQTEIIFEAFRQADGSTRRRYGGTGLGLSISRDLAQRMGGSIRVDSEPGRGSCFTLELPTDGAPAKGVNVAERHAPPASLNTAQAAQHTSGMAMASRLGEQAVVASSALPLPIPAASAAPLQRADDDRDQRSRPGRLILAVEDDTRFAQALVDLAHELDFDCVVAPSAEEALQLAADLRPSGILLDIGLPDASGLSVLERLKRDPATRHIPVHVVSAMERSQIALELGAVGYLIKPATRELLAGAIRQLEDTNARAVRRLLIVEDDSALRANLELLLARDQLEIVAVGSIAEAMQQLAGSTFDCMVTDLALPDGSGYDLLERMAGNDAVAFPPVIVYTGRALTRDEEQRLRRYSKSIIIKGVRSPERLLDEVTLFLHSVEASLPSDQQRLLREARRRDAVLDGATVLLAEDDVRNIFALSSVLEPLGVTLQIARNGREALEHLARHEVDLVLMDIMMPEMDGLTAMRQIRANRQWQDLPIIALTAKAMADDRERCLEAGANDYIAKPIDVDKLVSLCRVWCSRQ
ncbi:response regulator [Xanthomonas sp. WHRI 8391]|uniref:histidine kinase n=1 Tax=Xanthomonas hortorum pv. carotae TaxID=487904 RepID=A0A6V7F7X8_9XANT|nr:response regulator [Xanthomonas hortorum]ETC89071.1 two-component system sensor/response regulator fusionprotein [Xanthomonas hortorum pv. carotae str. M081]MBG3851768.1 response regulator [Xanthomonas hortorum pv. carotae]UTS71428.1 response regulator [Xanthomonas hortorum]CAD0359584.1 Sensor histidine kinase RcsC [Xanthomonas hortorum pv. carotae]CAD0359588.1 Sensor histidine kinase RcsC [Xanthomonas hortorum pv. carotae]